MLAVFFVIGVLLGIYVGSCFWRNTKEKKDEVKPHGEAKELHRITYPDTITISKNGECFHRTSECRALAGIASQNKRRCSFCCRTELWEFVGGFGEDENPSS